MLLESVLQTRDTATTRWMFSESHPSHGPQAAASSATQPTDRIGRSFIMIQEQRFGYLNVPFIWRLQQLILTAYPPNRTRISLGMHLRHMAAARQGLEKEEKKDVQEVSGYMSPNIQQTKDPKSQKTHKKAPSS